MKTLGGFHGYRIAKVRRYMDIRRKPSVSFLSIDISLTFDTDVSPKSHNSLSPVIRTLVRPLQQCAEDPL
jgi:hypothetical protein